MPSFQLSVLRPFEDPPAATDLAVFSEPHAFTPEAQAPRMLRAACRYARLHHLYLVPGRFEAQGQLGLCLISPQGEFLGGQRAIHLSAANRNRFTRSTELQVLETELGPLFLAVDADLLHPEVLRAAALKGARLAIGGLYLPGGDYTSMQGVCGAYNMARQNGIYVLDANNVVTSLAAPAGVPSHGGWIIQDSGLLPLTIPLDLSLAAGPERLLEEGFYRRYANQLGR